MVTRILQSGNAMRLSPSQAALSNTNAELLAALKQSLATEAATHDGPPLSDDRDEYEVTLKLFFSADTSSDDRAAYVSQCLETTLSQLQTASVDLLVMAFPGIVLDAEDEADAFNAESLRDVMDVYKSAQDQVAQGTVQSLGVSEFSAARLQQLYDEAAQHSDKGLPSVDQINLKDCCVMPADLIALAKERKIKLFTHGDLKEMLPQAHLQKLMADDQHASAYRTRWVSKVTCVVKSRGVVEYKGYAAMIER